MLTIVVNNLTDVRIVPSLAIGYLFSGFLSLFCWPKLPLLPSYFVLQDVPGSIWMFLAPTLESDTSLRNPGSFSCEMRFGDQPGYWGLFSSSEACIFIMNESYWLYSNHINIERKVRLWLLNHIFLCFKKNKRANFVLFIINLPQTEWKKSTKLTQCSSCIGTHRRDRTSEAGSCRNSWKKWSIRFWRKF